MTGPSVKKLPTPDLDDQPTLSNGFKMLMVKDELKILDVLVQLSKGLTLENYNIPQY